MRLGMNSIHQAFTAQYKPLRRFLNLVQLVIQNVLVRVQNVNSYVCQVALQLFNLVLNEVPLIRAVNEFLVSQQAWRLTIEPEPIRSLCSGK